MSWTRTSCVDFHFPPCFAMIFQYVVICFSIHVPYVVSRKSGLFPPDTDGAVQCVPDKFAGRNCSNAQLQAGVILGSYGDVSRERIFRWISRSLNSLSAKLAELLLAWTRDYARICTLSTSVPQVIIALYSPGYTHSPGQTGRISDVLSVLTQSSVNTTLTLGTSVSRPCHWPSSPLWTWSC